MIGTIDDMIGYFAICLANAPAGGKAETDFRRYILTLAELKQTIVERKGMQQNGKADDNQE